MTARRQKYREIGKALEQLRKSTGITQVQMSAKFSRPQNFISKIESGERRLDLFELVEYLEIIDHPRAATLRKFLDRLINLTEKK